MREAITCSRQSTWLPWSASQYWLDMLENSPVTKYCEYPPRREEVFSHKRTKYRGTMHSWSSQTWLSINQLKKKHCFDLWCGLLQSLKNWRNYKDPTKIISMYPVNICGGIFWHKGQSLGVCEIAIVQHCPTKLRWPSTILGFWMANWRNICEKKQYRKIYM